MEISEFAVKFFRFLIFISEMFIQRKIKMITEILTACQEFFEFFIFCILTLFIFLNVLSINNITTMLSAFQISIVSNDES